MAFFSPHKRNFGVFFCLTYIFLITKYFSKIVSIILPNILLN